MSYHGGGHRRRNHYNKGGDDEFRREQIETPEQKLQSGIIKLGEVDPIQELPRVAKQIHDHSPQNIPLISEAFQHGITEQPFKIPYYAALLRLLYEPPADAPDADSSPFPLGRQILDDIWKGFQAFLDKLEWRNMRLITQFFAHLTLAHIISPHSMFELLKSFVAVLDEFGVSNGRAKQAARCAAEGLLIAGPVIKEDPTASISEIIDSIQTCIELFTESKILVQPCVKLFSDSPSVECADELLDSALAALQILHASDFVQTSECFPQPYSSYTQLSDLPFELPSILVTPEIIELDPLSTDSGEDALVKKEEWAEYYVRLFENDVTPDPTTPVGFALRSGLQDLIDIFEVNRKECARLLLEFPKWCLPGTFKQKQAAPSEGKEWSLEITIIETILGTLFLLPDPRHKSIYYIALITELCKLSPPAVGPAVGKSIRKLYSLLADGLDVEIAHRLADWFSIHMSNFNFQWVWKEWIPDLSLPLQHPKRSFMRRVVDHEIRLSYYDRILKTLPESMQNVDALVMPAEAPGPTFEYDDPANAYHDAAQAVLNLLRGRAKADDVANHLQELKNSLETTDSDSAVDSVIRSIAVQSLLNIGSRSFSHFLNAMERYLPLLRNLASGKLTTTGGPNAEARMDILTGVLDFWVLNKHMVTIVFDKLMQYQIVDPTDIVAWAFTHGGQRSAYRGCNAFQWDVVKSALNKANGRVMVARRRVATVRKEEDENAAIVKASVTDASNMEVDTDTNPGVPAAESATLTTALKAFATLTREQKSALTKALDGFVDCLAADANRSASSRHIITEAAWSDRASWSEEQWLTWETWGWYRNFCRIYSPYLRNYAKTIGTISFAKVGSPDDDDVVLFKKTWNVATGQL